MALNPPALDPAGVETITGTSYPAVFAAAVGARRKQALGDALGLTRFGVNLVRLPAGAVSSQRHWHSLEEEFVMVLEGELVLVTDDGEQTLGPGMVAGFPAGRADGHQMVNRSGREAVYLEVGTGDAADEVVYPDIDLALRVIDGAKRFTRRDGSPY